MRTLFVVSSLAVSLTTSSAVGHEYWIDPQAFSVDPGETVVADLRVGERFEGLALVFNPAQLQRGEVVTAGAAARFESRLGDRPAIDQPAGEGLHVLVVETGFSRLTYDDYAKFEAFVTHKDARWVLDAHAARGLPETGFVEAYSRYAKSLVAVGDGVGADRVVGLETELVARANPYTDDLTEGVPVELFYLGAPRPGAQIEIFERAPDGRVAVSTQRTDGAGRARIPVKPGHAYMLDAVVLREPEADLADATGAAWESLWANLTFAVPE